MCGYPATSSRVPFVFSVVSGVVDADNNRLSHPVANHHTIQYSTPYRQGAVERTIWVTTLVFGFLEAHQFFSPYQLRLFFFFIRSSGRPIRALPSTSTKVAPRLNTNDAFFFATILDFPLWKIIIVFRVSSINSPLMFLQ